MVKSKISIVIFFTLYVLGYYAVLYIFRDSPSHIFFWDSLFYLVTFVVTCIFLYYAYLYSHSLLKTFWGLIFTSFLCPIAAMLLWSYYHYILQTTITGVSLVDVFYVLQFVILLIAFFYIIYKTNTFKCTRFLFDSIILLIVLIVLCWQFIIAPVYEAADGALSFAQISTIIYPVLTVLLLFATFYMYLTTRHFFSKNQLVITVLGIAVLLIANGFYSYFYIHSVSLTNVIFIHPFWSIGCFLIAYSSIMGLNISQTHPNEYQSSVVQGHGVEGEEIQHTQSSWAQYLPYGALVLIYFFVVKELESSITVTFIGFSILVLLILVRQIVFMSENEKLVSTLKSSRHLLIRQAAKLNTKNEQLEKSYERINYLAYHDSVTDLPNRVHFMEYLEKKIANIENSHQTIAILFIDLDNFKLVNDSLGHSMGDHLLNEVANRLKPLVNDNELLSRLGGDEFIYLIEDGDEQYATDTATKIIQCLEEAFNIKGHEIYISPSIGISIYPIDGHDVESLIKRADAAMYLAKKQGRNTFQFYNQDLDRDMYRKIELEAGLRKALTRNEFELYYQPIVALDTQQVIGAEALLRWKHPDWGMISPGEFIPIAEETGLIIPIGDWVLRTACLQVKEWHLQGFGELRVSVNTSIRQFQKKKFVEVVNEALHTSQLQAQFLELEITESILQDEVSAIDTLHTLKRLGLTISIDDFGKGFSSLGSLKKLPIDSLKVDRSFVRDSTTSERDAAIVNSIVDLGHHLKLKVIAEGIEKESEKQLVQTMNCDYGQGYLFGHPVDAKTFEENYLLNQ